MPLCPATKTVLPFSSNGVLAIGYLPPCDFKVTGDHLLDELGERRLRLPAQLLPRLAGITYQKLDFGRPEIHGIDEPDGLAGFLVDAGLVVPLAAPFDGAAHFRKRQLDEFAYRAGLACRQHEFVGFIDLQDPVHAFDVIPRMAPVALGLEISEIHHFLEAGLDAGNATRD